MDRGALSFLTFKRGEGVAQNIKIRTQRQFHNRHGQKHRRLEVRGGVGGVGEGVTEEVAEGEAGGGVGVLDGC